MFVILLGIITTIAHFHLFFSCWIQISYTSVSSFQVQTVEFILYTLGSLGVLIILEAIWEPEHLPIPITLW